MVNNLMLASSLLLWPIVLLLGFLLLGSLRALGLLRWRLDQLEATTPRRLGRDGLRPGKRAPDFALPSCDGGTIALQDYAGRKFLLVFMQPGCGPCDGITPELNRLQDAGKAQVLVVQNGVLEIARKWAEEHRPRFPVAVQNRLSLSKRYEVFATPFAFFIDERGVIASRGIATTGRYIGYILARAGHGGNESELDEQVSRTGPRTSEDVLAAVGSSSPEEVDHV